MCCVLLCSCGYAQGIKQQAAQQQKQQQYEQERKKNELKEAARIKSAQLKLSDLLQLLQNKDENAIEPFMSGHGWKPAVEIWGMDDYAGVVGTYQRKMPDHTVQGWYFRTDREESYIFVFSHPRYFNLILYKSSGRLQFKKTDFTDKGYKLTATSNHLDLVRKFGKPYSAYSDSAYEAIFLNGYDENESYFVMYNFKQVESLQQEKKREEQEAKEREAKFQECLQKAQQAYNQSQWMVAKQAFDEALALKPEIKEQFSKQIAIIEQRFSEELAAIKIDSLCQEAEELFKRHQYQEAKRKWEEALLITPNKQTEFIQSRINQVANMEQYLADRNTKQYDYKEFDLKGYRSKDENIKTALKNVLFAQKEEIPHTTIQLICAVDTLGNTTSYYTISLPNKNIETFLSGLVDSLKLNPCVLNDYTFSAKAEFVYEISANQVLEKVVVDGRKVNNNSFLDKVPFGKYTINNCNININGDAYTKNNLMKARTHGPANALLSVLVPGLGDHRVSYGERKGIWVGLLAYTGVGLGLPGVLFTSGEVFASSCAFLAMGAGFWIYDIIWVAVKGKKNVKAMKAYKQSHFGAFYEPNVQAGGLSYMVRF